MEEKRALKEFTIDYYLSVIFELILENGSAGLVVWLE